MSTLLNHATNSTTTGKYQLLKLLALQHRGHNNAKLSPCMARTVSDLLGSALSDEDGLAVDLTRKAQERLTEEQRQAFQLRIEQIPGDHCRPQPFWIDYTVPLDVVVPHDSAFLQHIFGDMEQTDTMHLLCGAFQGNFKVLLRHTGDTNWHRLGAVHLKAVINMRANRYIQADGTRVVIKAAPRFTVVERSSPRELHANAQEMGLEGLTDILRPLFTDAAESIYSGPQNFWETRCLAIRLAKEAETWGVSPRF